MEAFIETAKQAECLAAVDFSTLDSAIKATVGGTSTDGEALRNALACLMDAYSTESGNKAVLQCAVMRAICCMLNCALARRESGGSALLELDDYILLALFFNEVSTVEDNQVFTFFTEAVAAFIRLAAALAYGEGGGSMTAQVNDHSFASLRVEIQTISLVVSRRLLAPSQHSNDCCNVAMQLSVLECQRALLLCLLQVAFVTVTSSAVEVASGGDNESDRTATGSEDVLQVVKQVINSVLLPMQVAVCVLRPSSASAGVGDKLFSSFHVEKMQCIGATSSLPVSPLVLAGALRILEELLWHCTGEKTTKITLSAGRFAVTQLLTVLQQYLTIQQQQMVETNTESRAKGVTALDILRAAGPQRAVRRLLSVVMEKLSYFPSLESAVMAALNAFGGRATVENPFKLVALRQQKVAESEACIDCGKEDSLSQNMREWEVVPSFCSLPSPTSRLRECADVLPAPRNDMSTSITTVADFADLDGALLHSEGDGIGGAKEAFLKSSLGLISANTLVEMVLLSIRRMDIMTEQGIQSLHLSGLQQQQIEAARRAQKAEVQRLRRIEQQGVEDIPVGRLLEHLKESTAIYERGMQLMDSEQSLVVVRRAAFFSLLEAYDTLVDEQEGRVREAQALIARALTQMPPSMIDSGLDAVCARLRRELLRLNSAQGGGKFAGPCANALPLTSVYQLVMQILFTLYSAQAPVRERDSKALLFSGAYDTEETELQTRAAFTIDTDNPVGWLQAVQGTYGGFADRKRPRDGQSLDGSLAVDRGAEDTVHSGGSRDISQFFHDDTTLSSCAYSHFLCRVMELLTETGLPALLLDLLLQCPRITRHVWHYMLKHYCLSAEKTRCVLGMGLLKSIALRRAVYRRQALNSLLYISAVWFEYPRRLAVMQLGKLLDAPVEPNGRPVIDSDMEALLVRYAKRQIAAIPVTKLTSTGFDLAARKTKNEPDEEGARDAVMLPRDELLQLTESLDRCLGAFLMLCARQPRELFPALLDVFRECVERQNTTMVQLLAEHVDVRRMCQRLFQSNALSFLSNVMPYLRRCSSSSSMLVQRILWSTSAELRLMGKAGSVSLSDLQRIAAGLLGHAQVMYDSSDIPIVYRHAIHSGAVGGAKSISDGLAGGSSTSLHDVRFIAPFFSLIPAEDLKKTYLRSFLHFVELQLQLQEQRHQHHGIALEENHAVMESIRMSEEETQQFIRDVAREVLTRSPVQMEDGSPRGLSRIDLLVYLHRASGDNQNDETRLNVIQQGAGLSSVNASKAEPQGILNKPNTGPSSVSGGRTGADNLSLPVVPDTVHGVPSETLPLGAENLPLSPLTTRKVIFTLLELRRTFDNSTLEPLYGSEEIKSAVRRMMRDAGGASVPSQLMATLIFACDAHHQRIHSDLVRFVHHEVLLPLAKEATWEKDMQLWRGVLLFAEKYYRECSSFLVSLPDQVLIHALRDQQRLCEYFREEHGNNASFGHILGNL